MCDYTPDELAAEMFQVFRLMKEKMTFSTKMHHLSMLQIHTLLYLGKNEKVAMSDIADYFHVEQPSATSLVTKLYDMKLVQRSEDREDRRLVRISLTEEGKKLVKMAIKERQEKLEKILSYLSAKEKVQLLSIFKTLHNKLKE